MDDAFARFQADLNALPVSGAPAAPMMPPMMPGQPFMPPMGMTPAMYPPPAMPYTDYSQAAAATAADYNQAGYSAADYGVDYTGTAGYDYYDYTGQAAMQQAMGEGTSGQGSGMGMVAAMRNAQGASTSTGKPKKEEKHKPPKKGLVREAAGKRWRDPTLDEWPENDFRIFVGDLGNECNDDTLGKAFQKYPSFAKARIVKDKRTKKTKGFGFVSFLDSTDFAKALKEMNGKYIGNRPCKLRKSTWDERNAHLKNKK